MNYNILSALTPLIYNQKFKVRIVFVRQCLTYRLQINEFSIYDLYSEAIHNKKSSDSPSTVSVGNNPMTTRSHYQMTHYSIYDLFQFCQV